MTDFVCMLAVDPRDKPEDDGSILPMEFAVEAQKLIGISLEGTVG